MRVGKEGACAQDISAADICDHAGIFRDDAGKSNARKNWQNVLLPKEYRRIESDCKGEKKLRDSNDCRECGARDEPPRESFPCAFILKDGKRDEKDRDERENEGELPESPRNILRKEE